MSSAGASPPAVLVELVVQLQAADLREVVALGVEEQVVEEGLRRLERRRITRAQAAVDLHDRLVLRLDLVGDQRVAQVAADVEAVDEEHLELLDVRLAELLELVLGDLLVDAEDDLAGLLVDHVLRADLADDLVGVERQAVELRLLQLPDRGRVNLRFLRTMTSPSTLMSRVARWPARRSNSIDFAYLPPFSRKIVSVS